MRFNIFQISGAKDEIEKLSGIEKEHIPSIYDEDGHYNYYIDIESLSELLNIIQKTECDLLISKVVKNQLNKYDSYELCIADDWLG